MTLAELRKMTTEMSRDVVKGLSTEVIHAYIDALAVDRHDAFKKDDLGTVEYCDELVRIAREELRSRGVAAEAGAWICGSCAAVQTIKMTRCYACGADRNGES